MIVPCAPSADGGRDWEQTLSPLLAELQASPASAKAAASVAQACASAGLYEDAIVYFDRAKSLEPESAHRWACCAETCFELRLHDQGIAAYERALQLSGEAYLRFRFGELLVQHILLPERAEQLLAEAIARHPDGGDRGSTLAQAAIMRLGTRQGFRRLERLVGPAVALSCLPAWVAEGLAALGRYDEAKEWFLPCLAAEPDRVDLLVALGEVEQALGATGAARVLFERALGTAPAACTVVQAYVYFLLRLGDLDGARRAFRSCASRVELQGTDGRARPWRGESIENKTLLLGGQFGYGDAVQYGRFARALKQAGASVVVECDHRLANLVRRLDGIDRVVLKRENTGPLDYQLGDHLQALLLEWSWASIAAQVPYLDVPVERASTWRQRTEQTHTLRVGVNWQGMPLYLNNPSRYRSVPLELLAPLSQVSGVTLYSLQFGAGSEQTRTASFPILDLPRRYDFLDAAAAVSSVDVVVTIDSALAHIAGALGKTSLMLLPCWPCWRWMAARDDSPWYPSMRLLRQTQPGRWTEPIEAAARALSELAARPSGGATAGVDRST